MQHFRPAHPRRRRDWLVAAAGWGLLLRTAFGQSGVRGLGWVISPARALRFGVLPMGGAHESRSDWAPLLTTLENYLSYPVTMFSARTHAALARAVADDAVDLALLSGKLAVDAVEKHGMCVVARVLRGTDAKGDPAILVTRAQGPRSTLQGLLEDPDSWRLARGERGSFTGFIIPQLEFFFPHGVDMETRFASEVVGTHQEIALAVANGEADLGATNAADFQRFALRFPREARLLHVVWTSERLAYNAIAMRCNLGDPVRRALQYFFSVYQAEAGAGTGSGSAMDRDFSGFLPAGNESLLPAAHLIHDYARARALQSEWITPEALERQLARLDAAQAARIKRLQAD